MVAVQLLVGSPTLTALRNSLDKLPRGRAIGGVLAGFLLLGSCGYEMLRPWPVASAVLAKFNDRAAIPVSFRFGGDEFRQESYILIPSLRAVTIEVAGGKPPHVEVTPAAGYVIAGTALFGLYVTIFIWKRWNRTARSAT